MWIFSAATGVSRPVVTGATYDQQPTWFPDGSRSLFVRGRETDAEADIWSVQTNGTDAVNLTNSRGVRDMWPATACLSPTVLPTPTPVPDGPSCVCSIVRRKVPASAIADALAHPERYYGWLMPRNPSLEVGPANPVRQCLSLQNRAVPYHPLYNHPIWRVGCP